MAKKDPLVRGFQIFTVAELLWFLHFQRNSFSGLLFQGLLLYDTTAKVFLVFLYETSYLNSTFVIVISTG